MPTSTTASDEVRVGVLVAGGESRRMGRDKRGLRLDGETLLRRNLTFLSDIFPTVALSVRHRDQVPAGTPGDVTVVADEVPGSPMGGLTAVLARFRQPVFVLAADLIAPNRGAVERVLDAYRDVDVALPITDDHLEPLHAVYGPGCLPHMRRLLTTGAYSLLDLFPLVRVVRVPFADAIPFFNVNTPDDWTEARRRLGGGDPDPEDPAIVAARSHPPAAERPAVLGVVGRPNSGKTTLIEALIPRFVRRGLRVGTVKRVAAFDIDVPGKDSWRHSQAGADASTVVSASKLAFVARQQEEMDLAEIVARYFAGCDLVICEGYRREARHVVEVFRVAAGHESPVCDPHEPLAVVTDAPLDHAHRFGLGDADALAGFLAAHFGFTAA